MISTRRDTHSDIHLNPAQLFGLHKLGLKKGFGSVLGMPQWVRYMGLAYLGRKNCHFYSIFPLFFFCSVWHIQSFGLCVCYGILGL